MSAVAWHRSTFAAFDLETTGVDVNHDRIVTATIATLRRHPGGVDIDARSWIVDPGIEIPTGASDVHGITTAYAAEHGQDPAWAVGQIADLLRAVHHDGVPVVAFNAAYDFTLLERECRRYGAPFTLPLVIDPFVIDKNLDRFRKGSRKLTDACKTYGVTIDQAHNSTDDALAAARLAWALAERYPDQVQIDPAHLHANQIQWKREQADSFGAYLTKQGKTDDVAREWPVQSPPADWSPERLPVVRQDVPA